MSDLRFFEIAAQIIPFLFLALMVEVGAEGGAPSLRVRQIALGALGAVIAGAALGVVVFDSA